MIELIIEFNLVYNDLKYLENFLICIPSLLVTGSTNLKKILASG